MLKNKNVVIYGVSQSLGGAVARAMAQAGARLFITNRQIGKAKPIADEIKANGGVVEVAQVDVLQQGDIEKHLSEIINHHGHIDVSFNLAGVDVLQDIPLVEMYPDDFIRPIATGLRAQFLTATAAGRYMLKQRSGVILTLTATPAGIGYPNVGGFGPLCAGIENFSRNLACELGVAGVRVVNIRSAGSPDSRPFLQAKEAAPDEIDQVLNKMKSDTMLKDMPLMEDIASTAVFLASNAASKITGTTIDVTVGTTAALNHRTS